MDNTQVLGRNAWVDACRSTAIVLVLLSHGRHFLTPVWPWLNALNVGGFLGVELFFVISGFLIGELVRREYIHTRSNNWVFNFWSRRWLRTLPNYYLFLLVNAVLIALAVEPGRLRDFIPFLGFVQNLAWPHPAVFGEAWSLAVEEVFYIVFPLSLLIAKKVTEHRMSAFLGACAFLLLASLMVRFIWVMHANPPWDEGVRKIVVFRLDALMFGVLTAWAAPLVRQIPKTWRTFINLLAVALVSLSIGSFFCLQPTLNASTYARVWLFPLTSVGFGLAILAGLDLPALPTVLNGSLRYFARLSYALYLSHMPVFHTVNYFLSVPAPLDFAGAVARWCIFVTSSIVVAALVEAWFERPILDFRDRHFPRH